MRTTAGITAFILACGLSFAGEITPLGPAFLANSRTTWDQHDVWVACDDDGNFVISYAQGDIFYRRFGRNGTPLSDDVQLNLALTNGTQDETYAAMDPATGDFLICYSDRHGNDGDQMGCAGRFFRADGTAYGTEKILNTHTVESQFEPHAAFMPNGRVMVAWGDAGTDGSCGVIGRIFNRVGTPLTGEFLINEPADTTQIDPSVSCSRDGLFVCAYVDAGGTTGEPREVLARLYDQYGSALGPSFLVNSNSAGQQRDPIVAMDGDGDFVVVWQDESGTDGDGWGIYARLFDSSGIAKGPQFLVTNTTAGDQRDPQVTCDYVGNFVVTWESNASGDFDLYLRRFGRNGSPLSTEMRVHTNTAGDQTHGKSCLTQGGDRLITVWYDSSGDGDIYARLFTIPFIQAGGSPSLTQTVNINLDFPGMGGEQYMLFPSMGDGPGVSVNGYRRLNLAVDSLLLMAYTTPESAYFSNIVGTLGPQGTATATFTVPDSPEFYGAPVYFAGLTLESGFSPNWDFQSGAIDGVDFLSGTVSIDVNGPVRVHPGQEIVGQISTALDEDRGLLELTKGEKVKLKLVEVPPEQQSNAIQTLRIELLDEAGVLINAWNKTTPAFNGKSKKVKFKAAASGAYQLRVVTGDETIGFYKLTSSHTVNKKARARKIKAKVGNDLVAKFNLLASRSTLLSLTVKPLGSSPTPGTIVLLAPGGAEVNVDAYLSLDGANL
ncbi:MAG: hypothetical protein V2A76_08760, partial [Planctomycetota bacterium]